MRRQRRADAGRAGFGLFLLMIILAAGGSVFLLVAEAYVTQRAPVREQAIANLARVRRAAQFACLRNGTFPTDLNALAAAAGLDVQGSWRRDPFQPAQDLVYGRSGAALALSARGDDLRANTADDVRLDLTTTDAGRARTRDRERLIRSRFVRSAYRFKPAMTATERSNIRLWSRDYATARRDYLWADPATQTALSARMVADAAAIAAVCTARGCTALPVALTGAGGLMGGLGLPDTMAVDGFGQPLQLDPVVGVVSVGGDGTGGTADDL